VRIGGRPSTPEAPHRNRPPRRLRATCKNADRPISVHDPRALGRFYNVAGAAVGSYFDQVKEAGGPPPSWRTDKPERRFRVRTVLCEISKAADCQLGIHRGLFHLCRVCRGPNLGHAMVSLVVSPCNSGWMECGALAVLFPAFDGVVVGMPSSH
jgi:hypothetical protein